MAWQFLESVNLTNQWKTTDWVTGNLFKIVHVCSFPASYSFRYTGLIGQILNDTDFGNIQLYGEIQKLYFDPPSQYIWFNPLDGIDLRKLAIKGYWSAQTTFNWTAEIYVWDDLIGQNPSNDNPVDLSELTNLNTQLLDLVNQLTSIDKKIPLIYNSLGITLGE